MKRDLFFILILIVCLPIAANAQKKKTQKTKHTKTAITKAQRFDDVDLFILETRAGLTSMSFATNRFKHAKGLESLKKPIRAEEAKKHFVDSLQRSPTTSLLTYKSFIEECFNSFVTQKFDYKECYPSIIPYYGQDCIIFKHIMVDKIFDTSALNTEQRAKNIFYDVCLPTISNIGEINNKIHPKYVGIVICYNSKDYNKQSTLASENEYLLVFLEFKDAQLFKNKHLTSNSLAKKVYCIVGGKDASMVIDLH